LLKALGETYSLLIGIFFLKSLKNIKNSDGGKTTPCGVALLVEDLMQAEKIPEPWLPITNGPATTAHSAMAQPEGG
jgi:hypothetical protein